VTSEIETDADARPRLTLRVGITGHRTDVLSAHDIERLRKPVGAVLDCLHQTARSVLAEHTWAFRPAPPMVRLATSLAEGADTLTAQEARRHGYALDVLLPFNRADYAEKQGFGIDAMTTFDALCRGPQVNSVLELEDPSDLSDDAEVNAAYLRAGHAVVAHSDVLIAIWDGRPERGTGGTAQVVRAALGQGLTVVLIPIVAGESPKIWLPHEAATNAAEDGHWESLTDFSVDTCAVDLADTLSGILSPPQADTAPERLRAFFDEPWRAGSFWCFYDALRFVFACRPFAIHVSYDTKEKGEADWRDFLAAAAEIGGSRFRDSLKSVLLERFLKADNAAVHYSHVYRSGYILNFAFAALSVFVGLLPVLFWHHIEFKWPFVVMELVLLGAIIGNTWQAHKKGWHQRWLDYRSLAEILRPSRLPTLLGGAPAHPFSAAGVSAGDAWVSWYVRASLREIGPPTGKLDRPILATAIDAALSDEINGQITYHGENAKRLEKLNHRIHLAGACLIWITIFVAVFFLVCYGIEYGIMDADEETETFTRCIKPWATLLAASLPAFGSALFGIRATGDFVNFEKQSRRTAGELEAVRQALMKERTEPRRARIARLFDMATQAMATDLRTWGLIYRWREIELP
jgi:hypothetical protein